MQGNKNESFAASAYGLESALHMPPSSAKRSKQNRLLFDPLKVANDQASTSFKNGGMSTQDQANLKNNDSESQSGTNVKENYENNSSS